MKFNYLITTVILLLIIFISLNIVVFVNFIKNKGNDNKYNITRYKISNLDSIIGVTGLPGVGKTTFSSGISHIMQELILDNIDKKLKEIKTILLRYDFDIIDQLIYSFYDYYENIDKQFDYNFTTKFIMDEMKIYNVPVFNFIEHTTIFELLKDYNIAFVALLRSNFVQSKTRFYSRITNKWNLELDLNNFNLFEVAEETINQYSLNYHSIFMQDESSDDNSKHDWRNRIDLGSKQARNKVRHIWRQTSKLIVIRQDAEDETKDERSLIQNVLEINGRAIISKNNFYYKIIESWYKLFYLTPIFFKVKLPYFFKKVKMKMKRKKYYYEQHLDSIYNTENPVKKLNNKLFYLEKHKLYHSYIVFSVNNNYTIKESNEVNNELFYIPVNYCYAFPRFEYDKIQDDLIEKSSKVSKEVNPFVKPDFFKEQKNKKSNIAKEEKEVIERVQI